MEMQNESKRKKTEEDGISLLPDCLLIEIISLLEPIEEAIRTGILSKRWLHLWPQIHNLTFIESYNNRDIELSKFYSCIDQTLEQCRTPPHSSNLIKFKLHTPFLPDFELKFSDWILYAIDRNVQHLDLSFFTDDRVDCDKFKFAEFFPINTCFTHLKLESCDLISYPKIAISWTKVTTLSFSLTNLNEAAIESILSGCPLLETFKLSECIGYQKINLTSRSVKNFVFSNYMDESCEDVIEINAPYIQSLTIENMLLLWKLLLLDVSSVVKAELNYSTDGFCKIKRKKEEKMLQRLITSLNHVNELKIGILSLKVLSRLEAKGFVFPSGMKLPDVPLSSYYDSDSSERIYSSESSDSGGRNDSLSDND